MAPIQPEREFTEPKDRETSFFSIGDSSIVKIAASHLKESLQAYRHPASFFKKTVNILRGQRKRLPSHQWEVVTATVASFLQESDRGAFAKTCPLHNKLIQEVRTLILWNINEQKKSLEEVIEERQKQGLYGGNLEELTSLLEQQVQDTKQKLSYLELQEAIPFEYFLRLSAICEKTAKTYAKIIFENSNREVLFHQLGVCKEIFYHSQGVFKLVLSSCPIEEISCNFAQEIELIDCKELHTLRDISRVKKLVIRDCSALREISFLVFLEYLEVFNCESLNWIKGLLNVREIKVFSCSSLKFIEDIPRALRADIRSCNSLVSLYNLSFSIDLRLQDLPRLQYIQDMYPVEWKCARPLVIFFTKALSPENLWLLAPPFFFYLLLKIPFGELESAVLQELETSLETMAH